MPASRRCLQSIIYPLLAAAALTFAHPAIAGDPAAFPTDGASVRRYEDALRRFEAYRDSKRPGIKNDDNLPFVLTQGRPSAHTVLLLHGYPDSPWVMRSVGEYFHRRGFNVVSILLPGHGTKIEDLYDVTLDDWKRDVMFGLGIARAMGRDTVVSGFSTGGAFGVYLAVNYPEQVQGLVLFAPAFKINVPFFEWACDWNKSPKELPLEKQLVMALFKPIAETGKWIPENDPYRYRKMPVNGGCQLWKLENEIIGRFREVKVPTITIASESDNLTDLKTMREFAATVRAESVFFAFPWHYFISHPAIPSAETNPKFYEIEPLLDRFSDKYFP